MKTFITIFFVFLFSISFSQVESVKVEKKIVNEKKVNNTKKKENNSLKKSNNEESQSSGIVKPAPVIIYQDEEKIKVLLN